MNIYTTRILTALFLFTLPTVLSSQGWTQVTSGTTSPLRGVFSASALQTVAVGNDGLIIGTTDGGSTWTTANVGTTEDLHKVFVTNLSMPAIVAVGDNGTIRYSINVGLTWNSWNAGTSENLYDIYFHDPTAITTVTIVGESGVILFSNNGGATWVMRLSPVPKRLNGVFFTNLLNGVIVGDGGVILHTTNGGAAWNQITSGTSTDLNHVFFRSSTHGTIVGDGGLIMNTTDGGLNWSPVTSPTSFNLERLFYADANHGWAVGDRGTIIRTSDGGVSWSTQFSGVLTHLKSVFFTDTLNGMVVGDNGLVLRTTNGGIPVELASFSASTLVDGSVALHWITETESGNYGFEVQRRNGSEWNPLGFVPGSGDSNKRRSYRFVDADAPRGTRLEYRLRQIDFDGSWEHSPTVTVENGAAAQRVTLAAAPNPAREMSVLQMQLPMDADAALTVYTLDGRRIARLHEGPLPAGSHAFRWNTAAAPAGMYLAVLDANGIRNTCTLIVTR